MRRAVTSIFHLPSSILICFGLLLVTCFWATSPSLRLGRYMILAYVMMAGIGVVLARQSLPVGLLWIWGAVVCCVHPSTSILFTLAAICYGMALIYISEQRPRVQGVEKNPRTLEPWNPGTLSCALEPSNPFLNVLCVIALANVAWQMLQLAGLPVYPRTLVPTGKSLIGLQTNVEETSTLLACCLPAFWRGRWRWLSFVPVAGILMTRNLVGAVAACAIGGLFVLAKRAKSRRSSFLPIPRRERSSLVRAKRTSIGLLALLVLALLGYWAVVGRGAHEWRYQMDTRGVAWEKSVRAALNKPWLGWGFGQYSTVIPLLVSPHLVAPELRAQLWREVEGQKALIAVAMRWSKGDQKYFENGAAKEVYLEAHNEFIEMLFAAGIPGVLLLLWAVGDILRKGFKGPRVRLEPWNPRTLPFYGFLASCLTALVFFSWQIVPIAAVTIVWAGLILNRGQGVKGSSRNPRTLEPSNPFVNGGFQCPDSKHI
jgi:O-antigen ligase